jgi:hypothetical protein
VCNGEAYGVLRELHHEAENLQRLYWDDQVFEGEKSLLVEKATQLDEMQRQIRTVRFRT